MHRIDEDGHVNNHFAEGDPALGQQATRVGAPWLNAVQEEIANAIEGTGATLNKENNGQLAVILAGLDERLEGIEAHVDQDEWIYPQVKPRSVLAPLELALPYNKGGAATSWEYGLDSALSATDRLWMGNQPNDVLEFPLGQLLPSGAVPTAVQLLVRASSDRETAADRMLFEFVRQTLNFGVGAANVPTSVVVASARDNGTAGLQVVTIPLAAQPAHDRDTNALFLRVGTGSQFGVRPDAVLAVRFSFTDPGPRNV
jgi:hypothetical protein